MRNEQSRLTIPAEVEQQILGACILDASRTESVEASGGEDVFGDSIHAAIYRVIRGMAESGKASGPSAVASMLPDEVMAGLDPVGGIRYIVRLAAAAISPDQIASYVDLAAEAKGRRALQTIMDEARAQVGEGKPVSDISAFIEARIGEMPRSASAVEPVSMMKAVTDALQDSAAAYHGQELKAVYSGMPSLDHHIAGFRPGGLYLLGGRPSMGKTAVALNMALNAARAGHPVIFASLEMLPSALAARAMAEQAAKHGAHVAYSDIVTGNYSETEGQMLMRATKELSQLPLYFLPHQYQDAKLLPVGVKQSLRRYAGDKLPLVIVDYAQIMRSNARSRYEQITEISITLKSMAIALEVPVIALSQLSRAVESRDDKRPNMADLRESGQLEQDADAVMFCYRHEYYVERMPIDKFNVEEVADQEAAMSACRGQLEIIVAKHRQGRIGTAHMRFNAATNAIWEDEYHRGGMG